MKKLVFTGFLLSLIIGLLTGCAKPTATPNETPVPTEAPATTVPTEVPSSEPVATPIVVTDALGRTVEFEKLPMRIVIAGKAGFMITDAAFLFPEAQERIIAYMPNSQTSNEFIGMMYPQTSKLTKLDTEAGAEQIAPLNPEVVLLKSYLKDSVGDSLEMIGIKVIYFDLETPEAIDRDILTLGALFGNQARADQLVNLFKQYAEKITNVTGGITEENKPSVLLLQYSDKGGEIAFKVPPATWLQTRMVELAGGLPIWKGVTSDSWNVVTIEQIAAWNPEIIFIVDYKGKALEVVKNLKADEKWALLKAVSTEKLFAFPADFQSWDQPDTRWPLALAWLAQKIQPDLFGALSMSTEIENFYKDFYGFSRTTVQDKIFPLVRGDL